MSAVSDPNASVDKKTDAHSIHHVNFPITDRERTEAFYSKVFGMKAFTPGRRNTEGGAPQQMALLMTHGNFDLHFSPTDSVGHDQHYHFAIEVEDWDGFIAHLDELGVEYQEPTLRPQNNSKFSVIRDPDGHHVELTWHGNRDW